MVLEASLVDRVRQALAAHPPVREVKMLGGLSFMVDEKMVVWVRSDGDLLVRAAAERPTSSSHVKERATPRWELVGR